MYHSRRPLWRPHLRQLYRWSRHRSAYARSIGGNSLKPAYFAPTALVAYLAAGLVLRGPLFRLWRFGMLVYAAGCVAGGADRSPSRWARISGAIAATHVVYGVGFLVGLLGRGPGALMAGTGDHGRSQALGGRGVPGGVVARHRRQRRPSGRSLESLLVFALFGAGYFIVGYEVVVSKHLVNFDSFSRLAHAYFVWFNDPPKLAAIGFVWPPIQTMIFLPFALIKPLATSLAALPAASATFMALTIVVLNHGLRATGMAWFARYPLLLAFGLNPMIVYYGANGMAEAVYLFFLILGVYFLIRWYQTKHTHLLAFVGIGMALAMLSRYEIVPVRDPDRRRRRRDHADRGATSRG